MLIETKNLTHIYAKSTPFERTAIKGINFHAQTGEFIGIIGHTGSGKSTFISHLNGLLKPTAGQILFDGEDIYKSKEKTRALRFQVGLVFQYPEYQLFEETVHKDIAFGPKNMGLSEAEINKRVKDAAALVGLNSELLEKSPFTLSGGEKRRAAIAGVMAMCPRVLILDEPTAGLDPRGREEIIANIQNFHQETGATILMVSHSMEEIARTVSRIIVMNEGEMTMDGTREEIFSMEAELHQMSLAVPEITQVAARLRSLGIDLPRDIFTVEQAVEAIMQRKGGC